jgi:hypothetical protein
LLEKPEDDLHHCPTKKGFTAALSVLWGADGYQAVDWVENHFTHILQGC